MRYILVLLIFASMPGLCQTVQTGKAETSGFCSPAVSGSNNQFTITCQNIPDKLRAQLVDLLNRVAKNQSDAETILAKLDGCLEGIKQVREQAAPWNMTEDQKKELKRLLKGSKAKFQVHVLPSERNASLFGIDLISVLKDSGWEEGGSFTSNFGLSPALVGVVILVTHTDFPQAGLLQSALHQAVGIDIPGELDNAKNLAKENDIIYIAIGAKPPVR